MINETDILSIFEPVFKEIKKVIKIDQNKQLEFKSELNLSPDYKKAVDLFKDIEVHSQGLMFPDKLFKSKVPNEDVKMYEYRKSIYEPVTKPDWRRGINNYNRVFNPQNFAITGWSNNENEFETAPAEDYFMSNFPYEDSIIAYFRKYVKNAKLEDANGVIALDILNYEAADNVLRDTVPKVYYSKNVLIFNKDYVLLMSDERSEVRYFDGIIKAGLIFYLYDDTNCYQIKQFGKWNDFEFEIGLYFSHNLEYIPVRRLGGVPLNDNLYQSHAADAVPPLNTKLFINSTLQASIIAHAYPIKYEFIDDCPIPDCNDGHIFDEENKRIQCSYCKGHGKVASNPLGVHQIRRLTGMEEGGETPIPPVGFVQMNAAILTFLRSEIQINEKHSFAFLGVDISGETASGTETATGRLIDRETLFSALLDFSNEIWDLVEFSVDMCGKVRYGVSAFVLPDFKKPNTFSIRTDKDITEEFAEATESNYPDSLKNMLIMQYQEIRFGSDEQLKVKMQLKQAIDRLYLMNQSDIIQQKAVGLVEDYEAILHTSFDTFIEQLVLDNPEYLDKDWKDIQADLIAVAKTKVKQQGTTDQILE